MNDPKQIPLSVLKALAQAMGYRFEQIDTDTEIIERMIRPDGSVAVTATRKRSEK
jgi:hypothetical protein